MKKNMSLPWRVSPFFKALIMFKCILLLIFISTLQTFSQAAYPVSRKVTDEKGEFLIGVSVGDKKLNNLVSELLEASSISKSSNPFTFTRSRDGWIFISSTYKGKGTVRIILDQASGGDAVIVHDADGDMLSEGMRYVTKGKHTIHVECKGKAIVDKLVVKAMPELMHCGLGFDPALKSFGLYDMNFLKKDILPNVTTMVVPNNITLPSAVIEDWHRQGKRFVAAVGINSQGKSADDHFKYWTAFYDKAPFIDGIIVDEFIINNPSSSTLTLSQERQKRLEEEQQRNRWCEEAIKRMRADDKYKGKTFYVYFGGSGKKLNKEVIGPSFIRTLIDCDSRIAIERYLFERSSEKASHDDLQEFVNGIDDWETKEPGVKNRMVIAFASFNMPPGGMNKQPNVDYLVWMDQQMNIVANNPALSGIDGLEWWTSSQSDEETVRFVGKLYRHYAIEGRTDLLTKPDPLFLSHIQNADFEKGTEGWTLNSAENGTIEPKSFPRYGRIEGRYMGLGRPADPEHIGDTFLWMKRSDKGPNTFSQTIKNLEPGRLYSMKMFSCDYNDLISQKAKKIEEANKFMGIVNIEGVDIDTKRSFTEMYASNPEPPMGVWITYHWKVFRAKSKTAQLTISDWPKENEPGVTFGQEQTFNFLEIEPYRE